MFSWILIDNAIKRIFPKNYQIWVETKSATPVTL